MGLRLSLSIIAMGGATAGLSVIALGEDANAVPSFTPAQIAAGAELYEANCAMCHGEHMVDPGGGFFDLRTFPPEQKARFVNSVSNGKNNMPPWRGVLKPEDIDSLFAYVVAGEPRK
jgi:mono/diheme cytochrome c family protein